MRSFRDEELEEVSFKLLFGTKCQRMGAVEVKKDPCDEQYKLIEFNARFGLWDTLSIRCGIDIPCIAYCDALGLPVEATHDYREDVTWVDIERDVRAFWIYNRQGQLSFGDWLHTLRGEKDWAVHSRDDWKPGVVSSMQLLSRPWSRVKKTVANIGRPGTQSHSEAGILD